MSTARLIFEIISLKNKPRTGWLVAGVSPAVAETVAEHAFATSTIAIILALLEGEDPARCALLGALHDLGETRTGDLTPFMVQVLEGLGVSKAALDEAAESRQSNDLPEALLPIQEALTEYRERRTRASQISRDANLLDRGIQGLLYQKQGHATEELTKELSGMLLTESARTLWEEIQNSLEELTAWWR